MAKKLCKLVKKDFTKDELKEYTKMVKKGVYVCRSCGRVGNKKNNLCDPKAI